MKDYGIETFYLSGGTAPSSPWIPSYIEETNSGMKEIDLRTRHFSDRKIFLTGEVDDRMANDFVSQILFLSREKKPVDIFLSSPGGSVNAGLVIYDLIQSCRFPVNIYCTGMAYSMGAVLLAGGQKGGRFILPHSKVMLHEPLITGGMGGSATSVKKTAENILEVKALINELLSKHTGRSPEEIDEATAFDNFMNAEEAIAFGIVDEIKTAI